MTISVSHPTEVKTHSMLFMQHGLTLIELMVSLVLVSLVTLATLSLYGVASSAYKTTDANQQLQDNARYLFEVLSQAVRQAGLQDSAQYSVLSGDRVNQSPLLKSAYAWSMASNGTQPPLFGYNNAKVATPTNVNDFGTNDNGGYNNSDVFGVRFFGSSKVNNSPTGYLMGAADGSVIDCRGTTVRYPMDKTDIGLSLFMLATPQTGGEPELQCINQSGRAGGAQPIIAGVESFQVMYGVDTDSTTDTTPNRWINAKNMTAAQWPFVRIVRFGIVLRGPAGSAEFNANAPQLYPLGAEFSKNFLSETGVAFTPPADNRLRKAFTFNISVRNSLEQI
jgi:type IV pilus assembly protein PilW